MRRDCVMELQKTETQVHNWFNHNTVNSNKPVTSITRETFLLLYNYESLVKRQPKFNLNTAKALAFFVLSTPDSYLSNLIDEFDAYRNYLQKIMNCTSKHYTWKLRDLTQHDRLILRLILSVIHPEDYDHEVAFVNKKVGIICKEEDTEGLTSRQIKHLLERATAKQMCYPVELQKRNGKYYLHDSYQTISAF